MYLIASGGGTKLAFNQNIIGIPTAGRTLDPIDISQFEKIRFSVTVNGSGSIQFYLLSGGIFHSLMDMRSMTFQWAPLARSPAPMTLRASHS